MKVDIDKVIEWLLDNTSDVTEDITDSYSVTSVEFDFFASKEEMIESFRKDMEVE